MPNVLDDPFKCISPFPESRLTWPLSATCIKPLTSSFPNFNPALVLAWIWFTIILDSKETKNILSRDSKGDPSILEVVINLNYKIKDNGKILVDKRSTQKNNYNNISDKFELKKLEEILIDNLIENLVSDIVSSASNLILNPMINDN